MSQPQVNQTYTLVPPVGGWNTRDPLDAMAETDAIVMDNVFPDDTTAALRNGYRSHSTGLGGVVEFLSEHLNVDGTRQLLAGASNKLWNASTFSAAATDITGASVITSNKWQSIVFRASGTTYTVFMNGQDQPLKWDGSAMSSAAYTGISDDATLIQPLSYKNRLYAAEKNTCSIWYLATTGAVQGALTQFDVQSLFMRGGSIQAITSWGRDSGAGLEDLFVIVSTAGEMLIYQGDNPSSPTWSIVGHYFCAPPIGRRCFFNIDADAYVITTQGVLPLSEVVKSINSDVAVFNYISDKIRSQFTEASASIFSNFGWQGVPYPGGKKLIINVPVGEALLSYQYVMNLYSRSWCRFTGIDASCWTTYNNLLYFGGMNGVVYQGEYGETDNGDEISIDLKQAFTYCGDRNITKRFTLLRPIFTGTSGTMLTVNVDTDFSHRTITDVVTILDTGGTPWGSPWGSPWSTSSTVLSKNWAGVDGIGRCMALRIGGNFSNVSWRLSTSHIIFEPGGYL